MTIDDDEPVLPTPPVMIKFEASDAIHPPVPPDLEKAVEEEPEDEETKMRREMYESAAALLNSSSGDKDKAWELMEKANELGHPGARLKIVWAKMFGSHYRQNPAEAKQLLDSLAEAGSPEAQMAVGFLHATGTVVNSSQSQALLYYTFGAFGGSPR